MTEDNPAYRDFLNIPLHPRAADIVVKEGEWFARVLASHSRISAGLADLDQVSVKHVRESSAYMTAPPQVRPDFREIYLFITGIISGVFWPFLIQEMRAPNPSVRLLAVFGILSGIGILMVIAVVGRALWIATRDTYKPPIRPSQTATVDTDITSESDL